MKTCGYTFRNKEKCAEEALQNSKCILHIDLPEDEESEEFKEINDLKRKKVEEKVSKEDFNFEGARLLEVDFSEKKIKKNLDFTDAIIRRDVSLNRAKIGGNAWFGEATIGGNAWFVGAKIDGNAWFGEATIGGNAWFVGAKIDGNAWFGEATIGGNASFVGAKIDGNAWFGEATIGGNAWFYGTEIKYSAYFDGAIIVGDARFDEVKIGRDALFNRATICKDASFDRAKIKGKIEFKDTTFKNPEAQKNACITAKNIWTKVGDRNEEDYYFRLEMEAKRKQKKPIIQFLELILIQKIFRYGTKWEYVLLTWFLVVFGFAFLFWIGNGVEGATSLWENIYFSIVTATTLGYGDYHPTHGIYQGVAGILAIFGAFMWAAFIAIFARKYMR
ncbi:MAG: pentapeptide repeat-containing protein [Methanocellales archaeon]|nr:pentapeptide repeat-containing protein [Methanocellales archaeon]